MEKKKQFKGNRRLKKMDNKFSYNSEEFDEIKRFIQSSPPKNAEPYLFLKLSLIGNHGYYIFRKLNDIELELIINIEKACIIGDRKRASLLINEFINIYMKRIAEDNKRKKREK
ncbi:MAG: hypothetical protein QG670_414 [Thermoproteota archaeon]|nr:hypothetical protein [Thermoproteota archaeon]